MLYCERLIYNLGIATVSDYTCNKLLALHGRIPSMNIIILLLPLEILQAEILHFIFQLKAAELFICSS